MSQTQEPEPDGPVLDELPRGAVVLAPDPYADEWRVRPFLIVSDEDYPFYPNGYLGVPLTCQQKHNTIELRDNVKDTVYEPFKKDQSFINPWNPKQVNDWDRTLMVLEEEFMDMLAQLTGKAFGM